jgi:DNA sulfur modification protein DndB
MQQRYNKFLMENEHLHITEHETWEVAFNAASLEASATMSAMAPVILYKQAGRQFMVTSFPLNYVAERVRMDNIKKGDDPDNHYNRPLIPDHVKGIANYLTTQKEYILPPLTLCVEEPLTVHVPRTGSTVRMGVAVLPQSISFIVTDGQHRIKAIQEAMRANENLSKDAIGVTIVNEPDITKVHQDFVDCAQTKPIPPALLASFNVRDPISRLVRKVSDTVLVFRDRIEKVGNTVGKNSIKLFTMNQLRAGVAELLTGDSTVDRPSLTRHAEERLKDEAAVKFHEDQICEFYRKFAAHNDQWTDLFLSAEEAAHDKVDTWDLRDRYVHFTATGLLILGRVGHYILQKEEPQQSELIESLAKLDWGRGGDLWAGTIVTPEGKLLTSSVGIRRAVMDVKERVGLELTANEQKKRSEESAAEAALHLTNGVPAQLAGAESDVAPA